MALLVSVVFLSPLNFNLEVGIAAKRNAGGGNNNTNNHGGGGRGRDDHQLGFQEEIRSAAEGWIKKAPDLASRLKPAAVPAAGAGKPFVFFHVRKGGGTTMRRLIANAAASRNLTQWIPCQSPASCRPFSLLPNDVLRDVYGSHVKYTDVMKLTTELAMKTKRSKDLNSTTRVVLRRRENGNETEENEEEGQETAQAGTVVVHTLPDEEKRENFDCLTNLRPTVSRVVSCWNYRMVQSSAGGKGNGWGRIPPSNELSAGDWSQLLPVAYDEYMGGCNNEIGRIFGSKIDEKEMNTLSPTTLAAANDAANPMFLHELNVIASRLARCVIIVPERCNESVAVMRHYLPWIDGAAKLCETKLNIGALKGSAKELTTNSSDAILAQNQLDELLFRFGETLFEKQHEIAIAAAAAANLG